MCLFSDDCSGLMSDRLSSNLTPENGACSVVHSYGVLELVKHFKYYIFECGKGFFSK